MKYYLILVCFLISKSLISQENIDNIWVFGTFAFTDNPLDAGSLLNFSEETPEATYVDVPFEMDFANASMCDVEGNLLFYTNGRYVGTSEHEIMENGDSLNADAVVLNHSMRVVQGVFIIPVIGDSTKYYVIHSGHQSIFVDGSLNYGSGPLFYSVVNFANPDFPLGEVIDKNTVIVDDTIDLGKLNATRHANGRDWWLLTSEWDTNRMYRYLINPEGIIDMGQQILEDSIREGKGQSVFSPDGTKYAHASLFRPTERRLNLFDFDRCEGTLSQQKTYTYSEPVAHAGVAFSPNSRYLYLIKTTKIVQFDTEAEDVWATEQVVAEYDGYEQEVITSPQDTFYISTNFFMAQLGPDGKIYINAPNSVSYLHVIHNPDEAGLACDVEQRGQSITALNSFSLPNFPNYRLGALEGSPCDTIPDEPIMSSLDPINTKSIKIYPNPTTGQFTLELSTMDYQNCTLSLYNSIGKKVHEQACVSQETLIQTNNLPAGLYLYEVERAGISVVQGKVLLVE